MIRKRRSPTGLAAFAAGAAAMCGALSVRATTSPPAAPAPGGQAVYERHCASCHGPAGRGDGPAAPFLTPRPRDFTLGRYKLRTTETGSLPTDEDIVRSVREGLPGSAMPA